MVLANPVLLSVLMCFVLNVQSSFSKTYDVLLSVNPLSFEVEHLVEADEFVLRNALARGIFTENLNGEIKPNIALAPNFNPISGLVSFKVNQTKTWSNGNQITPTDIISSLSRKNGSHYKDKFLSCIVGNSDGIQENKEKVEFKWKIKNPKCGNPYALLSHQATFIFHKNKSKTLKEYLEEQPISSNYKVQKVEKDEIVLKSNNNRFDLRFIFNKAHIENEILYKRLSSIKHSVKSEKLLNVGFSQTISFESLGLEPQEIASLNCLKQKVYHRVVEINKEVLYANSYSLHTSLALGLKSPSTTNKKCKPIKKEITISKDFSKSMPEITNVITSSGFKTKLINQKQWKELWFNEKIPLTIRLQKVRTNNIYSLFFSYFQSGISPYRRITKSLKKVLHKIKTSKKEFLVSGLKVISSKGFIIPIIHIPTLLVTTNACAKSGKGDIYFDFEEYISGCNQIK